MTDKFAIIGLGQFGFAVAKKLASKGAEVLAIDKDIERVELIKDDVAYAVALDSTDFKALSSQNIAEMDAILVAIGENIEGLLITTVQLIEMKAKRVIARAMSESQRMILEKIGVKEILSPEDEVGEMVAELLINPNMKSFMTLPDDHEIAEIQAPKRIARKTIDEVDFEDSYGLQLIAIKRMYEEYQGQRKNFVYHLIRKPKHDLYLELTDMLIILGKSADIAKFIEINR